MRATFVVLAGLSLVSLPQANAANQTPTSNIAFQEQCSYFEFGDCFFAARQALNDNYYSLDSQADQVSYPGTTPDVTLETFLHDISNEHGVYLHSSHGADLGGGLAVEAFSGYGAQAARDDKITYYVNIQQYGDRTQIVPIDNALAGIYYIGVTGDFVATYVQNYNTITFLSACASAGEASQWTSRVIVVYSGTVRPSTANDESDKFWTRMDGYRTDGSSGKDHRSVFDAIYYPSTDQLTLVFSGNAGTVLAPAVAGITPAPGSSLSSSTRGYVNFDAEMDTSQPAEFAVNGLGAVGIKSGSPAWSTSTSLSYLLVPLYIGSGSVELDNFWLTSNGSAGAIHLNPDGILDNRDTYSAQYTSLTGRLL